MALLEYIGSLSSNYYVIGSVVGGIVIIYILFRIFKSFREKLASQKRNRN